MLLHGAESFLRCQLRNFWHFMELKDSLPCSEQPTSCPYCVPHESRYCTPFLFLWALFQYFLSTASGVFLLDFPTKMVLFFPKCAIWPPHSPLSYLISQIIIGEEHRSWSFSLCSLLQSPVPLALLGSDIFSTLLPNTQCMFFPQCKIWTFTPTYSSRQNYSSVYFIFIFLDNKWEDKAFWTEW